jgi:hypothetical protein
MIRDELASKDGQALIDLVQAQMGEVKLRVGFVAQQAQFLGGAAQAKEGAMLIEKAAAAPTRLRRRWNWGQRGRDADRESRGFAGLGGGGEVWQPVVGARRLHEASHAGQRVEGNVERGAGAGLEGGKGLLRSYGAGAGQGRRGKPGAGALDRVRRARLCQRQRGQRIGENQQREVDLATPGEYRSLHADIPRDAGGELEGPRPPCKHTLSQPDCQAMKQIPRATPVRLTFRQDVNVALTDSRGACPWTKPQTPVAAVVAAQPSPPPHNRINRRTRGRGSR